VRRLKEKKHIRNIVKGTLSTLMNDFNAPSDGICNLKYFLHFYNSAIYRQS